MKTDDLIDLLVTDTGGATPLAGRIRAAFAIGVAFSVLLLLATIGARPDLVAALATPRVQFKIGFTLLLALSAGAVAARAGVPGARLRAWPLALPALVLALGVGAELVVSPPGTWGTRLVGAHAAFCVFFIPVLSIAPLAALIRALREGAPDNPGRAGAFAGLAAGSLAAAIYAWHCPDDSPLFVASWYVIGMAIVTAAGGIIGRRALRW
ncbi:NrsF family protein [Amaricoccus solimangrovi]|uniref:DUF1109 family protein n=1 Tax=Amaricoccus solimangrovi TaxID=2589815 RepID=A0A501WQY3_9RHOB|nr:NrsF family protein [Amaricoccus solimangrovi]TPE48186.1 DUF1109 family protein [Amaricoccus solimangrovi]